MTTEFVRMGARDVRVWPKGQELARLDEPRMRIADFADYPSYHERLVTRILAMEQDPRYRDWIFKGGCGMKVRHPDRWGCVEADLVHARAIELFKKALNVTTAVVDQCWASVYRRGDYCMPHSHLRTIASIVYLLDPGDFSAEDPNAAKLCFADPRIAACCMNQPGRMTNLLVPDMKPGSMLIFPSELVHSVNPYLGDRPRITLSWNIHNAALPGLPQSALHTTARAN
ncbi:MAG TPA: putative 2OG-Fe(II) oxygenase [Burkholderiales bacterium]|nr:putative 2OG-Fe(II) oxygenase [Burkholderiales bacterium]